MITVKKCLKPVDVSSIVTGIFYLVKKYMNKKNIEEIARKFFKFPSANPGQMEAIVDAVHAILSGKKYVIISAPTGTGKSIIATTVHRTLKHIKGAWRTTLITSTKGLQDQYTSEDSEIVDLRGRTNYTCPIGAGPYNSGNCRTKIALGKCSKAQMCPYVKKRSFWCNQANIRITNSSFQISAPPQICMEAENQANLIVVDECHEIDDLIVEHTSISLNLEDYQHARKFGGGDLLVAISKYIDSFRGIKVGETFNITDEIYTGMHNIGEMIASLTESLEQMLSDDRCESREQIGDVLEKLSEIQDAVSIFDACDQRKGTWILQSYGIGKMEIKPVYAWQISKHSLLRKAPHFLFMSATICGYDSFIANVGLDEKDVHIIEVENPIPIENRKVTVIPTQKISGNFDIDKLVRNIDAIISMNKGHNGIVHTVSFALANQIKERSKHSKNMLVSGDRYDILNWVSEPNGRIVLSPSIEKGYDFKGDLSRFQIIAKCPYDYLGSPIVALNAKIRPEWYARRCILRLTQACGRSIRGVDDWAKTYILDSNFLRLVRENHEIFPEWFLDSVDIVN